MNERLMSMGYPTALWQIMENKMQYYVASPICLRSNFNSLRFGLSIMFVRER